MKIGNITLDNNIFLAPMAGVTDLPFRLICKKFGAGLVYSEMVSSKAIHYGDKKTFELLVSDEAEKPLAVQIFGNDAHIMSSTAKRALGDVGKILDINMGCPAPKVFNNGDGSALLKEPDKIGEIVRAVSDAVDVPVTCKIRSGYGKEHIDVCEIAKIIEANGASAITVHPRTREMYYSGHSDWDIIRDVKKAVSIPVIGNGDIFTAKDAADMVDHTGCDAVMIARGAQGNPFLFRQVLEHFNTGNVTYEPSPDERMDTLFEHIDLLIRLKGEHIGIREARKHIAWYTKGLKNATKLRNTVNLITDLSILSETLNEYKNTLK